MSERKIKLTIQYDGSGYSGWQVQPGKRTIQGELNRVVTDLLGRKTTVHGASRTDAGVSALGQSALITVDSPIPTENFARAISDRLPADIVITKAVEVGPKFDVIGDVTTKLYRYTFYTGRTRPVLDIRRCWHIPAKLDIAAMDKAAGLLIGRHDFKSFASAKDNRESSVREVFNCTVASNDHWVYMDIEGDGFLYNMVRNIAGTLVDIGQNRYPSEKITEILEAKDRTAAGPIAPPQGLCLMWIKYEKETVNRRLETQ